MVAIAKARHQPGYCIRLKGGWDRHFGTPLTEKKFKSYDTIRQPPLPLRGEQPYRNSERLSPETRPLYGESTTYGQRVSGSRNHPKGGRALQSHPSQGLDLARDHPGTQETPKIAHRAQPGGGLALSQLRAESQAPHHSDHLLRCRIAHLRGRPPETPSYR